MSVDGAGEHSAPASSLLRRALGVAIGPGGEIGLQAQPALGARIPAFLVRVVLTVVLATLCVVELPSGFLFAVGLILTGLAVVVPRLMTAWLLILLLAGYQAFHQPPTLDWRVFVLLAGLHLIHVLAALQLSLPIRGWIQLRVFTPPLRRFVVIQVPAQALAAVVLYVLFPHGGSGVSVPILGVVGAAGLVLLGVLLMRPLLRERA